MSVSENSDVRLVIADSDGDRILVHATHGPEDNSTVLAATNGEEYVPVYLSPADSAALVEYLLRSPATRALVDALPASEAIRKQIATWRADADSLRFVETPENQGMYDGGEEEADDRVSQTLDEVANAVEAILFTPDANRPAVTGHIVKEN